MTFLDSVAEMLNRTKAEIPSLAVAAGLIVGIGAAYLSNWRENCYPLQFSERTQIERDAKVKGERPSANTIYHANALDIAMKTLEANNETMLLPSNKDVSFAKALKKKYNEPTHHFSLAQLTEGFDNDVNALMSEMKFHWRVRDAFGGVYSQIKGAWQHDSHDEYITVPVPVTHTDSDGNISVSIEYRQQYDHTDHVYNFHKDSAWAALDALERFLFVPRPNLNVQIARPSVINEPNLKAIIDSRKQVDAKKNVSEAEAQKIAKNWGRNAKVPSFVGSALGHLRSSESMTKEIRTVIQTADPYVTKRTSSSTDYNPPAGFGFYHSFANDVGECARSLTRAEEVIYNSRGIVGEMRTALETLSRADKITSNEIKAAEKARDCAEKLLRNNFSEGIPVPSKRWYVPVLWGIGGLLIGALAGLGLDYWAEKRRYNSGSSSWGGFGSGFGPSNRMGNNWRNSGFRR